MAVCYLEKKIVDCRRGSQPRYGFTRDGYTKKSGAPTPWLIRVESEKRFRRVFCWQFSNVCTLFIRIGGKPLVVDALDFPPVV